MDKDLKSENLALRRELLKTQRAYLQAQGQLIQMQFERVAQLEQQLSDDEAEYGEAIAHDQLQSDV